MFYVCQNHFQFDIQLKNDKDNIACWRSFKSRIESKTDFRKKIKEIDILIHLFQGDAEEADERATLQEQAAAKLKTASRAAI